MAENKATVKVKMARAIRRIDKIYDSFEVKNMTRKEFRQEFIGLADPRAQQRDLDGMKVARAIELN